MAAISIVTTSATPTPTAASVSANASAGAGSPGGFSALLPDAGEGNGGATPAASDPTDRQNIAVNGKDLPKQDDDGNDDKDQPSNCDTDGADALIWLAIAMPAVAPVAPPPTTAPPTDQAASGVSSTTSSGGPSPVPLQPIDPAASPEPASAPNQAVADAATQGFANAQAAGAITDSDDDSGSASTGASPQLGGKPAQEAKAVADTAKPAPRDPVAMLADALRTRLTGDKPAANPLPAGDNGTAVAAAQPTVATASASKADAAPNRADQTTTPVDQPDVQPRAATPAASAAAASVPGRTANPPAAPVIGAIQPAAQAFAAALRSPQPAAKRSGRDDDALPTVSAFSAAAGDTPRALATDTTTPSLDTRHAKWVEGIIDHIELIRDAADAGDTRIRLVPDALGKIDVAIRKDGDTVNVRFSSDQAPTRQLLADAQPRLAEIAAGRGLRLGQTLIDGGDTATGQQQRQGNPQQSADARQPIANARRVMADDSEQPDETAATSGWLA